jgi:enamine deaminase RidA (YjgF/YER057c/UK114 family)
MSAPSLNEAWSYGADFSRGIRLVDANKIGLHVSGTASIDEAGETAHVGAIEGQIERTLHNVTSLLSPHGASFADVVTGVVYLKDPSDAGTLRAMLRMHGCEDVPWALVEAPLCRPELLCEMEAMAILPLPLTAV